MEGLNFILDLSAICVFAALLLLMKYIELRDKREKTGKSAKHIECDFRKPDRCRNVDGVYCNTDYCKYKNLDINHYK